MNVRPIDGAALYEAFREELKRHPIPETPGLGRYRAQVWLEAAGFFITMLTKAPTIGAEPVRHGRWENCADKHDRGMDLKCSVCGNRASSFVGGTEDWWDADKPNYCPNCGAKMESGTDHE